MYNLQYVRIYRYTFLACSETIPGAIKEHASRTASAVFTPAWLCSASDNNLVKNPILGHNL
ncbi:hypothetical protein M728_005053 (plasmid) [Ensifer sp. WSM1721]